MNSKADAQRKGKGTGSRQARGASGGSAATRDGQQALNVLVQRARRAPDTLTGDDVARLQRLAGNGAVQRAVAVAGRVPAAGGLVQRGAGKPGGLKKKKTRPGRKKGPKAFGYSSNPHLVKVKLTPAQARQVVAQAKIQRYKTHYRHIIPHSDLQRWMEKAREAGDANSAPGQMRRIILALLGTLGENGTANQWQLAVQAYEGGNQQRSLLQENRDVCIDVWKKIEWHPRNLVKGNGQINTALQNRFDAIGDYQPLFVHWHAASTLLGLNPTGVIPIQVPTFDYVLGQDGTAQRVADVEPIQGAEHAESRPLVPILGARERRARR